MLKPDQLRKSLVHAVLAIALPVHAGDLLRGGAAVSRRSAPTTSEAATAAASDSLRANAQDALSRTTSALNAVRAMQAAARAAASSGPANLGADPNHPGLMLPNVPNGLAIGGLEVDPAAAWTGASQPLQSGRNVTITQHDQQAVLNWKTFNIGRNTALNFDQSAGGERVAEWVAFNKVNDPSGVPSQILGSITAQGQVYIINQNGIIFGGSSQVNTHTLVASSLPINENLVTNGLLNNPDAQFLFSALALPPGSKGAPAFNPPAANTPDGRVGDVVVQAGAQITAPTTADKVGGRVMLVGANVKNSGTISTPDGQTILAAGLQVGIDAHSSSDPSLRGLDVYIGAVADTALGEYAGTATNDGLIEVYRGNATMAGKNVNQLGGIDSSTSVSLNGRIDLLASYNSITNTAYDTSGAKGPIFLQRTTGTVTLGAGSAMQILPEWSSTETTVGTKLPLQSQVNITGQAVHMGKDSTLVAPGAKVAVSAGIWDYVLNVNEGRNQFVRTSGQIYIDSGAMINVAGSTDIAVAMAQYILSLELRGAELADSPVQRTGVLRGPTLTVDLRQTGSFNGKTWVGTPLADLSGYVGLIQRTAGELTVEGGSVTLAAGESVIMQKGSIIDVSGGFSNYAGGFIETTRVIQGGRLIDISQATPDQIYDGIYSNKFTTGSARWGVTETYAVPWMSGRRYEAGYVQGAGGGSIDVTAPAMALDGELRGNTVAGPRQRDANPEQSKLSLKFTNEQLVENGTPIIAAPTPPSIVFRSDVVPLAPDAFALAPELTADDVPLAEGAPAPGTPIPLREDRKKDVYLSPELLTKNGFGSLTIENSDGNIAVPQGVALVAPPTGSITLSGRNIQIRGSITAPAGSVTLKVFNFSPYLRTVLSEDLIQNQGNFLLGRAGSIDVAGLLVDDRLTAPDPFSLPLGVNVRNSANQVEIKSTIAGGSVAIEALNADLESGSLIDASGGVWMNAFSKLTYGNGGSISIKAGKDPLRSVLGGHLTLAGTLLGYSGARGASLTLQAPIIQVGGTATYENTLLLQPDFFSSGGFNSFTLIGIGADLRVPGELVPEGEPAEKYAPAVIIAPGTVIEPVVESLLAIPLPRDGDTFALTKLVKATGYRNPINLSFQTISGGVVTQIQELNGIIKVRSDIVMGEGARIVTDPLGSISFSGQTVTILGSVTAPGGSITVTGANKFPSRVLEPTEAFPTVYLGPSSQLSTKGTTVYVEDRFGRRTGSVLPGGKINVSGNIIADPGALLDVSGTSAVLDVHPAYLNLNATLTGILEQPIVPLNSGLNAPLYASLSVPHRIDSSGGSISLKGGEMLFTQATLKGEAGGPTATGGTLSISSGRFVDQRNDKAITLIVAQDLSKLLSQDLSTLTAAEAALIEKDTTTLIAPVFKPGESPIGQPLRNSKGGPIPSLGYFGANAFLDGGFDALTLDGNVQFRGPVDITARGYIKAGLGGIIQADSTVTLTAPYVAIGKSFQTPFLPTDGRILFQGVNTVGEVGPIYFPPTYGTGVLNIKADIIDIGTLSLQNIGAASLYATNDIRGNGTFNIAGNLKLTAGQIYPTTASAFTITAYDYTVDDVNQPGSVTIASSGVQRDLPLSAGGQLNIYGSIIKQGGVLRAPLGGINIGWDGTGTAPVNLLTNQAVPLTQELTLTSGSITSVSAVDSTTGEASIIPYGLVTDGGTSWIDPTGANITAGGIKAKSIQLGSTSLTTDAGSVIDISGGGDLLAYSFVKGNGGSTDILASTGSFAVIPGYDSNFSPYAPFNTGDVFAGDSGYVNGTIQVGDRVFLGGSDALQEGVYTLLPARYALLPGAVLVTPKSGQPIGTFQNPDGAFYVSGYRFNDLNSSADPSASLYSRFEVASSTVVNQRAKYETYFANTFLRESALRVDSPVPRLPMDGGYLLFQSTQAMSLQGDVYGYSTVAGGRGGLIDISTPIDIVIGGTGAAGQDGKLVLDSSLVSRWSAESILVGGSRTFGKDSTTVKVVTGNITVDNAGTPLSGPEIILASNKTLTLAAGAEIEQSGSLGGTADYLVFGDPAVPGSGNGTMLRVSSDPAARIFRNSVTVPADFPDPIVPLMTIGAGVSITGESIILDSTYATSLDPSASVLGNAISLNSGRISIQFDNPGALQPTVGLVLAGSVLQGLQSAQFLSLLSYSSIDLYGTGQFSSAGSLELHAGEIRGFNTGGGQITFSSGEIKLDNIASGNSTTPTVPLSGTLALVADTIRLGQGQLNINQYADIILSAAGGISASGTGGLAVQGNVIAVTPVLTTEKTTTHGITATGAMLLTNPGTATSVVSGLGGSLTLRATSIAASSNIVLPSGTLDMRATTGGITISGLLDVSGTSQAFFDVLEYSDAGRISLLADNGNVQIDAGGFINVSAQPGGGDAGVFSVEAPNGAFVLGGTVMGQGGAGGLNGSFNLDAGSLPSFSALNTVLNNGLFTESRTIRLRSGSVVVDGVVTAHDFRLSTDAGSITVAGAIDASGTTGGTIDLKAKGSVTLDAGAILDASAQTFSNAGKGGAVFLEAGSQINGVIDTAARVDIQTGSTINLTVATNTASSPAFGQFTGSLHIRAPMVSTNNELQISPINGTILGASKIEVEGYKLFNLTPASGTTATITSATQTTIRTPLNTFGAAIGAIGTAGSITNRILANNAGLDSLVVVMPGAEVINTKGDLVIGVNSATSPAVNDWNLATWRFGTAKQAPGVLTLRAAGNLVFNNALSDGFDITRASSTNAVEKLWTAPLLAQNLALPVNAQSWSFRLVSGADFTAADFHEVRPLDLLASNSGSVLIGQNAGQATVTGGSNATTRLAINPTNGSSLTSTANRYQVIRTGSGDIDVVAGRDVQLLNQFATIYTAGTQVATPTTIYTANDFVTPIISFSSSAFVPNQGTVLGAQQQQYFAQYSMAGGNVNVSAQQDIKHLTKDAAGNLIIDSSRQLPENWLYRRGYVDPTTGLYGETGVSVTGSLLQKVTDPAASTTWWIDFSNFFSGVAALGGGDVTLTAGRDVQNVDAHTPTNARAPKGTPDASKLQELGGGDLTITAGRNIDGGVYYVERGLGTLNAGASITTNSTRSPSLGRLQSSTNPSIADALTWLPTTLFAGKTVFDVSARGDVLLGPVVNPFWLPQGLNNKHWYKTYFTTYSADSAVNVSSLGGNVTLREGATLSNSSVLRPLLDLWVTQELTPSSNQTAAFYQPWLRIVESSTSSQFSTVYGVMPATLQVTAFTGDVNIAGNINLFPSPTGSLEILASGAINGLQPVGVSSQRVPGQQTTVWASSTINLSDSNPATMPGVTTPFAYYSIVGRDNTAARTTTGNFLSFVTEKFIESGSSTGAFGTIQRKQALHSTGLLHANDYNPVNIYAGTGSISGFTLFSSKSAQIIAGKDITDVSFYIQNVRDSDVSVVSSGRDILIYNPNSPLRVSSQTGKNLLVTGGETVEAGDIQISGPGTLEVLAGRNLDLGSGANNADGTGVGIVSIGNARNPYLPFGGADIIAAAGLGGAGGLGANLDFEAFIDEIVNGPNGERYLSELSEPLSAAEFTALPLEEQRRRALSVFFLALRDAGRDHNELGTNYEDGFAAIEALFPASSYKGDISLTSREIKTRAGGDISVLAPGGKLLVGIDRPGTQSLEQGILTERGGSISIFTNGDVDLGTSRIFTLRGGDVMIWSSTGDIAAGAASKTVQSAPPTRVIIDAQSANVQTDLSGLATGGGIGVLDTVAGVVPGNVDLIAPVGVVDAGDAGIRSSGNLNIAATAVLNASNITVAGTTAGTPSAPVVSAPNIGGLTAASSAAGSSSSAAEEAAKAASKSQPQPPAEQLPSIINVEVIGYGGAEGEEDDERKKKSESGAQ